MSADEQQNKPFKIKLRINAEELSHVANDICENMDSMFVKPQLSLTADDIGKEIKGEGIYLGTYTPVDRDGVSLKKVFNVFAAPEDLFIEGSEPVSFLQNIFKTTKATTTQRIETFKYVDALKHVKVLKNFHGHDGTDYATDKELYAALKDGAYNGGWIIPTRDILHGKDVDGKNTTPDNILAHKDKGSLKGTFKMATSNGSDCPHWYWSSTQHPDLSSCVYSVRFSDGHQGWDLNDTNRLSCRPVRLVVIK